MSQCPAAAAAAAFDDTYVELNPLVDETSDGTDSDDDGIEMCPVCKDPDENEGICEKCWPQYNRGRVPRIWTLGGGCEGGYRWWLLMSWEEKHVVMPVEISFYDVWYWHKPLSIKEFPGVKAFHLVGTPYNMDFRKETLYDLKSRTYRAKYVYVHLGSEATRDVIRNRLNDFVAAHHLDDDSDLVKPLDGDGDGGVYAAADTDLNENSRGGPEKRFIGQILAAPGVIAEATAMPHVLCLLVTQYWRPEGATEWVTRKVRMDAMARERNEYLAKAERVKQEWDAMLKQQHAFEVVIEEDEALMRTERRGVMLREEIYKKFKRDNTRLRNKTPHHFAAINAKAAATRKRNAEMREPGNATKKQKLS